jgi:hypothetical protein
MLHDHKVLSRRKAENSRAGFANAGILTLGNRLLLRDSAIVLERRDAMPRPTTFDEGARTIEAVIASTTPVKRADSKGQFWEILDPAGLDLEVTRGSSILDSHVRGGVASIIGAIDDVWIEGNEVIARIRFSDRAEVQAIISDVRSGIISFLSVGYEISKFVDGKNAEGERTRTATKWAAREASFVAVAADPKSRTRAADLDDRGSINRAIRTLGREAGLSLSAIDGLIDAGATVEETRMATLNHIVNRGSAIIRAGGHNANSLDNPEVFERAAADGMFCRMQPEHQPQGEGRQFANWNQTDLARECLTRAGINVTGMQASTLITRAMQSTSDYVNVLAAIMDKSMRLAYAVQPLGIRAVARETGADDFRAKSRVQFDSSGYTLDPVSETGEYHFGSFVDTAETYGLNTFGKIFAISRKALINDNLGVFNDVTRRAGIAAAEFQRQYLVSLLLTTANGPLMADGAALFDPTHGNLVGTGVVISVTSLGAARQMMRAQVGPGGGIITVVPKYLVVPSALETLGEMTVTAIQATQVSNVNPFAYLTLVVEPRLVSQITWYMVADLAQIDGLEYAYLNGAPGPQTESQVGFNPDGIQIKTRLDFGAGFVESRGWLRNPGA